MNSVQLEVDFSPNLTGDRIKLPPSYLDKLLKFNPELPSPLTFRLLANSIISHASVLEFTSSENVIQISDFLADKLSVTQGQVIEISLVHLEKCTFAKLAPLTANYLAIKDIRSLLEAYLRKNHTTLTVNESLLVNIGKEESVTFLITELKPDPQCLCLNTDMEVDMQPLDNNLAEDAVMAKFSKNDNVLQWKSLSSNPTIEASGSLDVEDAAFFKV
ncbi:hypothetical protein HDV02_005922 [Globomyces sp. JEL0801]|nr:hypothetical protein HDV02_005922 [Globomyces sp. JEL0801]